MTLPAAVDLNTPFMTEPPSEMSPPSMDQATALLGKALETEVPLIEEVTVSTVELPAGYISSDGVLHQTAEVRELNGYAEEKLSRLSAENNTASYVTELLLAGVVRIGDENTTREMLKSLLIGDRDALVIAIRQVTYGNNLEFKLTCTSCKEASDVVIELDKDIEVRPLEDPMQRVFTVELRNGRTAKVGLLNGVAQEAFTKNFDKKTTAEINTAMLAKSVIEVNGLPVRGNEDTVRALSTADRTTLIEFIANNQPGPQFKEIEVPCANCGAEYPISLGLSDLFRF
jgi:hypothetical protein